MPEPRPVPDPIGTAVEVAEEAAAVVANDRDVVMFERAWTGWSATPTSTGPRWPVR
ncbi:hypothetical protein [Streptomyces asiaticus]|uniref:hypothetical protein n=1 Tax=Streptomyces asiaticus TaxID=114695 RepID=UPI0037F5C6CD